MSSPQDGAGIFSILLEWAWAGVLALGGLVFKGVKDDIQTKADKSHVQSIYDGLEERKRIEEKLFDRINEESDKTSVQFAQVTAQINQSHIELLNAIHNKK